MGMTVIEIEVGNPANPEVTERVEFLVDSGAIYSVVPAPILNQLGIRPLTTQVFRLANGDKISRRRGVAMFKYRDRIGGADVIFGEPGDSNLLGTFTLEALGLALDPLRRELRELPMILGGYGYNGERKGERHGDDEGYELNMDAELQALRNELGKLKGRTIFTVPQGKANTIVDVSPERGVFKRALDKKDSEPVLVTWTSILKGYDYLRKNGEADNETGKFGMGSFTMPLLAELTTVEWVPNKKARTLRYLRGNPQLRSKVQSHPKRRLTVVLERDEDGYYVASVPELMGCHTQGETLDEVMENIRDAASLCLEVEQEDDEVKMEFIGIHTIEV